MKRLFLLLAAVAVVTSSTALVFAADTARRPSFLSRLDNGIRRRMYPRQQVIGGALGTGVLFALNRLLAKSAGNAERQHHADVARREELQELVEFMNTPLSDAEQAEFTAIKEREAAYEKWQKWRTRGKDASAFATLLMALFTGHGFLAQRERAGFVNGPTPAWLAAPAAPGEAQLINKQEGERALLLGVPSAQRAKAINTLLGLEGEDDVLERARYLLQEAHRLDPDSHHTLLSAFTDDANMADSSPFADLVYARRQIEAGNLSLQNLLDYSRLQPSLGNERSPLQQIYYEELLRRSEAFAKDKGLNLVAVQGVLGSYVEGRMPRMNQPAVVNAIEALKEVGVFPEGLVSDSVVVWARQQFGMTLTAEQQVIAARLAEADKRRAEACRKAREEFEREKAEAQARRAAAEAAREEARQKKIDELVETYAENIAALRFKRPLWVRPRDVVEKWLIIGRHRLSAPVSHYANADEMRAGMEALRVLAAEPMFAKTKDALTQRAKNLKRELAGLAGRRDAIAALQKELVDNLRTLGLKELAELELLECLHDSNAGAMPLRRDLPEGYSAARAAVLRTFASRDGVDESDADELRKLADRVDPLISFDRLEARYRSHKASRLKALQSRKRCLNRFTGQFDSDREARRTVLLAAIKEQIAAHPDNARK